MCGLWRLDPDLTVTRVEEGIICTNGPCWSPDDRFVLIIGADQALIYDIETALLTTFDTDGPVWDIAVVD